MSDAISKAIEAMGMARSAVGPFAVVVTRKLTESIDALQALQSGEPVVDKTKVQTVDDLGDWLCREMELELAKASHRTLTVDAAKINTIKEVAKLIRFYRDNLLSAGKGGE
jgi:hypothetical protein